jgi:hypothetical protein
MTFDEIILKKLADIRSSLEELICAGTVEDYARYKFYAGQIHGIAMAEREIHDLLSSIRNGEED